MRIIKIDIFLLIVLTPIYLISQTNPLNDDWRWIRFTTEYGLPSNRVMNICETKKGTIWANTQLGLAWFNGYHWEAIGKSKGLFPRMMSLILADERDSILVIIDERLYYGGQNGFRHIPFYIGGKEKKVGSAAYLGDNSFLLISNSHLYVLKNDSIKSYDVPDYLKAVEIYYSWNTNGGSIWLNTSDGLYRMQGEAWSLKLKKDKSVFE